MTLDRTIFKAIKGHTADNPQDLVRILAFVDARERLLLSYEELSGGLQRLIQDGRIAEAEPQKYFDSLGQTSSRGFSSISLDDYEKACETYQKRFWEADRALKDKEATPDDFTRQKLVIRWKLDDGTYATDDDEDAVEVLCEQIEPILNRNKLAEINGFEFGPGHIDILIFGKETDDDLDSIYADIAPAFRAFPCPPGSHIIRLYEEKGEVVSDVVT